MAKFTVILDIRLHGSSFGTTEDVIEASTADEAVEKAIKAWKAIRPDRTFHELFVIADPNQSGGNTNGTD